MKNPATFWLKLLSIIAIAVLIVGIVLRPNPSLRIDWERPNLARIRNAGAIGVALSKFKFDHNGHLPNQLSELVPKYIPSENVRYFFPPSNDKPDSSASTNLSEKIDANGAFIYLGDRGIQQDLILYERTNLWPSDLEATNVMILTSNLTTKFQSGKDVEARLFFLK